MSWDLAGKAGQCRHEKEDLRDKIGKILYEGEDTEIGRIITLERIREEIGFGEWVREWSK